MLPSEYSLEGYPLVYPDHEDEIDVTRLTIRQKRSGQTAPILCIALSCLAIGIASGIFLSLLRHAGAQPQNPCGHPPDRREWRTLSGIQRHGYLKAVLCLKRSPSRLGMNQSLYDDFPWVHAIQGGYSHTAAGFLAWHRYFIHVYEKALREQCHYEGYLTYWDWTLDWKDVTKSPVWDLEEGFGGNGNVSIKEPLLDGYCLTQGPFSRLEVPYIGADYKPHCLSRRFQSGEKLARLGQALAPQAVESVLNLYDYESFNLALEDGPHLAVPKIIRGDFQYFTAPNDPLFILHHTQLDRLWWIWQQTGPAERQTEYLGKAARNSTDMASISDIIPMGGLAADVHVSEILRTHSDLLCYSY